MKRKSLVFKLIATISVIILIVFFATGVILSYFVRQDYFNLEKEKLDTESNTIQEVAVKYQGSTSADRENIYTMLHLISNYLEADIMLVNSSGYIYGISNDKYQYLYNKRYTSFNVETLELEFEKKQNRQIYWDDVAMFCHFQEYELGIYPMQKGDLIEIDDFSELCELDPSYCGYEAQGQEKSEEK